MSALRTKSTLPILFSVIVIDLIGFGIVLPILPFYAKAYGASGFVLGVLFTSHAAMQMVFAPIWGRMADRVGRRPVMLGTIAGTGISLVVLGTADSLTQLFVGRLLTGTFAANISVATAYISDVTEEGERTRWMGMVGASFGVGFLLGPGIGGLLSHYGYGVPMLTAAGFAGVNFVWAALMLREPARHARADDEAPRERFRVLAHPAVRDLCLTYFLYSVAVAQLETIFAYYMEATFDYDAFGVAMILVLMAFVMMSIQGGGIRPLVARFGEKKLVLVGVSLMCLAFAAVPLPGAVGVLLVPLIAASVGRAISQPSLLGLVSFEGSQATRGAVMGVFQGSASAARVVGPLAAGALFDVDHAAPFWLAAALTAIAVVIARRVPGSPVDQRR